MVLIVFSNSSSKGKEEVVYHHVWFYFCGKTRYLSLKVNSIQELASWSLREIIKSQRERKKGYIWTFAGSMVGKSFLSSPIVCSQRDAPSLDTLMPLLSSASSLTSCCTSLLHSGEPMSMLWGKNERKYSYFHWAASYSTFAGISSEVNITIMVKTQQAQK